MFSKILIANRSEIACRIIRTCRRMKVATVAVYSQADADALHVAMADEAVCIGPAPARESYLSVEKIIQACAVSGAQALHPGYGFLSERPEMAEACAAHGVVFIGPPPSAMRAMGLKGAAKALMAAAGVPTTPGYHGEEQTEERLLAEAEAIGWPVLIKAVAGGGGKGMRRVDDAAAFSGALAGARREAAAAFGNDAVLIEKYLLTPRHIEVQVFADAHGGAVHLFERDCSVQRRHQKVIEESPAPGMTAQMRAEMGAAAIRAVRAVDYVGAGTVEFICDVADGLRPDRFFFMEMNTRLQVEHPVTEAVTGHDLVEWQLRVAAGELLPVTQEDLAICGHAVEARLYAEDPARNFMPSSGKLARLRFPPETDGLRVDSGVREGDSVTPYYDPLIAKIIAKGSDRAAAVAQLASALEQVELAGVHSNAAYLANIVRHPQFAAGGVDTRFIEEQHQRLVEGLAPADMVAIGAWLLLRQSPDLPEGDLAAAIWLRVGSSELQVRSHLHGGVWAMRWADRGGACIDSPALRGRAITATVDGRRRTYRWAPAAGGAVWLMRDGITLKLALAPPGVELESMGRDAGLLRSPGAATAMAARKA